MNARRRLAIAVSATLTLGLAACGDSGDAGAADGAGDGVITVSGSSTVAPITRLAAREGGFEVEVEAEGTVNGFERFCSGDTMVNNASAPIPGEGQPTDFVAQCEENGVEFVELPIGLDTLTVVRNDDAEFLDDITMDQLTRIWESDSDVDTWADVDDSWPEEPLTLYGRDYGSGTYASFSEALTGDPDGLRGDYTATDDLVLLSQWIAEDPGGLGFMGVGNYLATEDQSRQLLSTVSVDGVEPSLANAQNGTYPITRPLFIYVSTEALEDDRVREFAEYYLDNATTVLPRSYFYPLERDAYPQVKERLEAGTTGTEYADDPFPTAPTFDS